MHPVLVPPSDPAASAAVPVLFVTPAAWRDVAGALGDAAVAFAAAQGFDASSGQSVALPDPQGRIVAVRCVMRPGRKPEPVAIPADIRGRLEPFRAGGTSA